MAQTLLGKLRQSIFPDYPRGSKIAQKDGSVGEAWHLALSNLFQNLQSTFSNEGFQMPKLSSSDIDTIEAIYNPTLIGKTLSSTNPTTPDISGRIVYDIDNYVPKIFIIEFATAGDPNTNITSAKWKTFTIT